MLGHTKKNNLMPVSFGPVWVVKPNRHSPLATHAGVRKTVNKRSKGSTSPRCAASDGILS